MPKLYRYIGPAGVAARTAGHPASMQVSSVDDIVLWIRDTEQ